MIFPGPSLLPPQRPCRQRLAAVVVRVLATMLAMVFATAACSKRPAPTPMMATIAGADPERGKAAIERYGCTACHAIPGIPGHASNIGPPLDGIAGRVYLAGVLPNIPDRMVRWLRNPPEVDPATAMPNMGISEAEAKDIAAYLYTLH